MPVHLAIPALAVAALCSAAMMWSGVNNGSFSETAWSAAAFAIVAVLVGWHLNSRRWKDGDDDQLTAMRRNGQVTALVYAWGAVAMVAMYKLTGLYWQHGLQYAAGMLLFATIIFGWTRLSRPGGPMEAAPWPRRAAVLNVVHGSVAAIAVIIFLISGKLWASRPDWAANIVFLAGGFSISILCALAAITHSRLSARA